MHGRFTSRLSLAAGCAVALLVLARPAPAGEEVLRDSWSEVRIGGAHAGWQHQRVRRLGDPETFETFSESEVKISRMGMALEISSTETDVERPDGSLVSIHSVGKQSAVETTTDVEFSGAKATISTTLMGKTRKAEIDIPDGTVGPWRLDRTVVEKRCSTPSSRPSTSTRSPRRGTER
jgi:hypothetical protein